VSPGPVRQVGHVMNLPVSLTIRGPHAADDRARAAWVRRAGAAGEVVLDPTGVVKGWAVERAADHLRALEATDFCLSVGGDMACRTLDPDAPPWRIGIEDPHHTDRLVAVAPSTPGRWPPPGPPTAATTWWMPAPAARRRASPPSRSWRRR
jgi:hypothetical protein